MTGKIKLKYRILILYCLIIFITKSCFADDDNLKSFLLERIDIGFLHRNLLERAITPDFIFDEFFSIYDYDAIMCDKNIFESCEKEIIPKSDTEKKNIIRYKKNFLDKFANKILTSNNYSKNITMFDEFYNQIWNKKLAHFLVKKPLLNENFVVVPTAGALYVLDINNGEIYWQYDIIKLHKNIFQKYPLLLDGNILFFVDHNGKIIKIDLVKKKIIAENYSFQEGNNNIYFYSDLIVINDNIFLSDKNNIFIFDNDLNKINEININKNVGINKIMTCNDELCILTNDNKLSNLDKEYQLHQINSQDNNDINNFFTIKNFLIILKKNKIDIFSLIERKIIQTFNIEKTDVNKIYNDELHLYNKKKNKLYILKHIK